MSVTAAALPVTPDAIRPNVDELVRSHLPLVGHLVRELAGRLPSHINRDDLASAGMMALVTSAQGFDDSRGVPFARFATIRIRGALTDELRNMDWASRGVRSRAREVDATRSELTASLGRSPRREEVARKMGVDVADLDSLEADVHRAAMLSVEGLTETAGGDLLPSREEGPEGVLVRREQIGTLHDAIAELPERLRIVIEAYFYGNQRMADIAADLGVTESRVSQLRTEALSMLRDGINGQQSSEPAAPAIPAQRRGSAVSAQVVRTQNEATPVAAKKPSRREAARQAYIAAIASRSTLAGRLAATTTLGETRPEALQALHAAQ